MIPERGPQTVFLYFFYLVLLCDFLRVLRGHVQQMHIYIYICIYIYIYEYGYLQTKLHLPGFYFFSYMRVYAKYILLKHPQNLYLIES